MRGAESPQKVSRVEGLTRREHPRRPDAPTDDTLRRLHHQGRGDRVDVSPACHRSTLDTSERATTSTRKVWDERPLSSVAGGGDRSGSDRSLSGASVMYVRISRVLRCRGIVTLSAVVNSPSTACVPIGATSRELASSY
jgi:hypothetical protein